MAGHLVALAAFFVQAYPRPPSLHIDIFDAHFLGGRADAREGIGHQGNQGAIAQAHDGRCVDRFQESAGLVSRQHGRLAFLHGMFRTPDHAGGVRRHGLAHDKPVEQHPQSGELQLDGRSRDALLQLFDVGGDVDGLHVAEMAEASRLAPGGECGRRLAVGFARMRIPDVGGKELEDAFRGRRVRSEKRVYSVPDAGSTAALLGVSVAIIALARRKSATRVE